MKCSPDSPGWRGPWRDQMAQRRAYWAGPSVVDTSGRAFLGYCLANWFCERHSGRRANCHHRSFLTTSVSSNSASRRTGTPGSSPTTMPASISAATGTSRQERHPEEARGPDGGEEAPGQDGDARGTGRSDDATLARQTDRTWEPETSWLAPSWHRAVGRLGPFGGAGNGSAEKHWACLNRRLRQHTSTARPFYLVWIPAIAGNLGNLKAGLNPWM